MNTSRYAHISDQELLEKFYQTRDNEWLGILLERYTMLLFGVCMKYMKQEEEAKDCVQQVFMKAVTELHKYRVDYIRSWLYMIARNHCLMRLRDRNQLQHRTLSETQPAPDELELKEGTYEKEKLLTYIEACLNDLSAEQKTCVVLFYLQKKSYQEIAALTGYSLLQVKSYIQNGKRNLKLAVERKLKNES